MTPQALLTTCTQAGVILKWDGNSIKARGEERAISTLLPILRSHKAELHAYFEAEQRDYYEERAAIAQYDGGLSRGDAEAQAFAELQAWRIHRTFH